MEKLKNIITELCNGFSISGHELYGKEVIKKLASGIFDEIRADNLGNFILVKKSGKKNAKKLLIDAHFDTVGMMVSQIKKGGFLKFVQVGGLDPSVLPSTEVIIHGKEDVYGIITSTPPHLKAPGASAPKLEDLMIDTGYSKEKLEELVSIGDPICFKNNVDFIYGDNVTSAGLDDKACLCAIFDAMSKVDKENMAYDVYVTASAQEETGKCGPARASFEIEPDIAITTDVNFAKMEKGEDFECIEIGKGAGIDISSLVDRRLTRNIRAHLDSKGIKYQIVCEPTRTGTNNDSLSISYYGVRTALMSIPLKSMHTPSETVNLADIKSLSDILVAVIEKEGL